EIGGKSFFFVESSRSSCINFRQACAVESAALHHPSMTIRLLLTAKESRLTVCPLLEALKLMGNLQVETLDADSFFAESPLHLWYSRSSWNASRYKISHLSDAIRFLLVWKYGGIYCDLDIVVKRRFGHLRNSVGEEEPGAPVCGVLIFDKRHPFIKTCIEEFSKGYDPKKWAQNGPGVIKRALSSYTCNRQLSGLLDCTDGTGTRVAVHTEEAFYAVPYQKWRLFFERKYVDIVRRATKKSYLVHIWNALSHQQDARVGSGSVYDLEAHNCPRTYALARALGGRF
ncbi:unnamed protein product, partial [Ixodes pacificus]